MAFADLFLEGASRGAQMRRMREQAAHEDESRKLEIARLKLEGKFKQHQLAGERFKALEGTEPPIPMVQHSPVDFPQIDFPEEYGGGSAPGFSMTPRTPSEILKERLATLTMEGKAKALENDIPTSAFQSDFLQRMGINPQAESVDPAMLTAGASMYGADQRLKGSKLTAGSRVQAANIAAGAIAGLPPTANQDGIGMWAGQLAEGRTTIGQIPDRQPGFPKGGYRTAVMLRLHQTGQKPLPPAMLEKMNSFIPAETAIAKLEDTLDRYANPNLSPGERAQALLQFRAEREGFTRLVGRAMGEKGVFTDQDAAAFATLLAPNVLITGVAPGFAKDRLGEVRKVMENIREREFAGYFNNAPGAPGANPPQGQGQPQRGLNPAASRVIQDLGDSQLEVEEE